LKKCKKCNQTAVKQYVFTKCLKCGHVYQDFSENLEKGWKLKMYYDKEIGKFKIIGNTQGLEYLASSCLHIIGNEDPSGHVHLEWQMNTLNKGSTETILEYSDDEKNY